MSQRNFMDLLRDRWDQGKAVCVGLDSDVGKLPDSVFVGKGQLNTQHAFNCHIVRNTRDIVCAYKPNLAFYRGAEGKEALKASIEYIHEVAPLVPVILDAKYADIGNTNDGYAAEAFDYFGADAVTVHPYLGAEAMGPFLDRADKGVIVLCRTSNPGAGEFQDRLTHWTRLEAEQEMANLIEGVPMGDTPREVRMYHVVAHRVARYWNSNGNCAVVVGATYPGELAEVRGQVGDLPILIPGIGAQGGDVEATVSAGRNSIGHGMIINNSRGIIFASKERDYADAARAATIKMHDQITAALIAV